MEKEKQLEAQKPRRTSLVDPYLIEQFYGPPSLKKKTKVASKSEESPAKSEGQSAKSVEAPSKKSEEVPPMSEESEWEETDSEVTPTKAAPVVDASWADSDSEEEGALTSDVSVVCFSEKLLCTQ